MSKFFLKLKDSEDDRFYLSPGAFACNNPYRYTQALPPAYQARQGLSTPHSKQEDISNAPTQDDDNSTPYHDWTSIPDTSLLPPPPAMNSDYSSTTNASYSDAAVAHAWCAAHPVQSPRVAHTSVIKCVIEGRNSLDYPPRASQQGWSLKSLSLDELIPNTLGAAPTNAFRILSPSSPLSARQKQSKLSLSRFLGQASSASTQIDMAWISHLPVYLAATSNPLSLHFASPKPHPFIIYFEIMPLKFYSSDSTVSIGYAALPYPSHRQPGWHRASIGVHSDDGNRYINDSWGGREFTTPFREGETIGLAVELSPELVGGPSAGGIGAENGNYIRYLQSEKEVRSNLPRCKTRVYMVRNGVLEGSWMMDEERDAEKDEGVAGLMGEVDLYAAVGVFGDVDVEVRFYRTGDGFVPPLGEDVVQHMP